MKNFGSRPAPPWISYAAALLAAIPIFVWVTSLLAVGLLILIGETVGSNLGIGPLLLSAPVALTGGALAAVVVSRYLRRRFARLSLLAAAVWLGLFLAAIWIIPMPYFYFFE